MNVFKIALLGSAALVAASVGARADSLEALKSSMNDLTIGAVADAPAAAAPATVIAWSGRVRAGVVAQNNATAGVGSYRTDIVANTGLYWAATTQTAVGEVGVGGGIVGGANSQVGVAGAGLAGINNGYLGGNATVTTDGFSGWWKMTPNLTLRGGVLGNLSKSSYSWDAAATNWYAAKTGGGVTASSLNGDPAAVQIAYADGPLGFAVQVEDSNNGGGAALGSLGNNSAFGVTAKASYKMDAIGFDLSGGYWGDAWSSMPGWSVNGGLGYSAGPFSVGAAIGTGVKIGSTTTYTPGSAYAKLGLSDSARIEMGVTRDFATGANVTTFGGGIYYSPAKQITLGAEAGYVANGANDGSYSAALISAFTF